jgi:hypothetical protein
MATITLGGNTYNLITLPSWPGFNDVTVSMTDAVAVVKSPYNPGQSQTQAWPGADAWAIKASLPKLLGREASYWRGFLAAMRGMTNVVQLGDPLNVTPLGVASGAPIVSTPSGGNMPGSQVLTTRGWTAGVFRQLQPGDYLQVGYRLYQAAAEVDADSSGDASISIFPSLRETPADGTTIQLANCRGVFRLATNDRKWRASVDKLTEIELAFTEVQ